MIVYGIISALIATFLYNVGPVFQKKTLNKMDKIQLGQNFIRSLFKMLKNTTWLFGTILSISGIIPFFFALEWAGMAVTLPVMSFGTLILLYSSRRILHEKLNFLIKVSITLIIAMPFFLFFSDVSQPQFTRDSFQSIFWLFVLITCVISIISFILTKYYKILWSIGTGLFASISNYFLQLASGYMNWESIEFMPLFYAFIGLIFMIIMTVATQFGLQQNQANQFNPIKQTVNSLASTLASVIVFNQVIGNIFLYLIGLSFAIIGSIILSSVTYIKEPLPVSESFRI